MARPLGRRPLGGLLAIFFLGTLFNYGDCAIGYSGQCSLQELTGVTMHYGLQRVKDTSGDRVLLVFVNSGRASKIKLEAYANTQYRLFLIDKTHAVVVRCKESADGAYECGMFAFDHQKVESRTRSYDADSWSFIPFTGSDELLSGLDMNRIFLTSKKVSNTILEYWLYLSYNYKVKVESMGKTDGVLVKTDITKDADVLAGCFDANMHCQYDYKTQRVAQFRNDISTMFVYDRLRFYSDGENFLIDEYNEIKCYEKRRNYLVIIPYFSPVINDNDQVTLLTQNSELFSNSQCPSDEDFETLEKHKKEYNDDEYDDEGKRHVKFGTHGCPKQGRALLAVFIVSVIISVFLTLLLVAMIIITVIAKQKMKKMGKKMPKKPWETQATEDCTTFMDQTMGVTEATTVGETTGYTTVAQ